MAGIQITPPASPTNHKPHKTLPSKTDNPLVVMGTGISGGGDQGPGLGSGICSVVAR